MFNGERVYIEIALHSNHSVVSITMCLWFVKSTHLAKCPPWDTIPTLFIATQCYEKTDKIPLFLGGVGTNRL